MFLVRGWVCSGTDFYHHIASLDFILDSPIPPRNKTFSRFPELPTELKLAIWRNAIPNPREIQSALCFVTSAPDSSLDLAAPRAILPSIKELREASDYIKEHAVWPPCSFWEQYPGKYYDGDNLTAERLRVMSLFHTYRDSRNEILKIFFLNIESTVQPENAPGFDPADIVCFLPVRSNRWLRDRYCGDLRSRNYIQPEPYWRDDYLTEVMEYWLLQLHQKPLPQLSGIQQMAFLITANAVESLATQDDNFFGGEWFKTFPALQYIHILYDPGFRSYFDEGKLHRSNATLCAKEGAEPDPYLDYMTDCLERANGTLDRIRRKQGGPEIYVSPISYLR